MSTINKEQHSFQAEVKEVLDIVVNSLYTDKEIFIRELISNASDALEKLRHTQLTEQNIFDEKLELEINLTTDDKANTLTIQDFGIGMTREELNQNLGTIAHSGSKAFLASLKEKGENNESLIGKFGVGFYSSFMVADSVTVHTHSWKPDAESLIWESEGVGSYTIEESEGNRRGCKMVIRLKDKHKEFSSADTVKRIIKEYSSFVPFPINLNGDRVNTVDALWLRNKSEIKDEEYKEFYKFQSNAWDEPSFWLHFNTDAPLEINSLLFVPSENREKMGLGQQDCEVSLYCRKVLIDGKPKGLLPDWMRFLKGVVDSADLPLNISRETMQDSQLVQKLNKVLSKRFIKHLETLTKKDPDSYNSFYEKFGVFLKEGVTSDFNNKDGLIKLLRFESSQTDENKKTSLKDYLSRMPETQKEIYYLFGKSRESIESSPYLEAFTARGIEVLFLSEPVDEFVMQHIYNFEKKDLKSIDSNEIKLEDQPDTSGEEPLEDKAFKTLQTWFEETLKSDVKKVEKSERLIDSPAMVLNTDPMMTGQMRKMMKQMGQAVPESGPSLSLAINPRHPLIKKLAQIQEKDTDLAELVAKQIFDSARLASGLLEEPKDIVQRMYQLLEKIG